MRVLVVGLGWVARRVWLPRLLAHPTYEVVGAVEPAPVDDVLEYDFPVFPEVDSVHDVDADVIFVLTPNATHASIAGSFLARGRNVFLEKPTCRDEAGLRHLRECVARGGGRLALSTAARHRADVQVLREHLSRRDLGEPRLVELGWIRAKGIPHGSSWTIHRAAAGGGVLIDLGWHLIDLAVSLLGLRRAVAATTIATSDFLRHGGFGAAWRDSGDANPFPADVEDTLTSLVRVDDGTGLLLRLAWASHDAADQTSVVVHGTDATIALHTTFGFSPNRIEPSIQIWRAGQVVDLPVPAQPVGAEYDRVLDELPALLSEPAATDRAMAETAAVLGIVEACYQDVADRSATGALR